MHFRFPSVVFPSLFAVLLLTSLSSGLLAQEIREVHPGSDQIHGMLTTPDEVDFFPFQGVEGTVLTLKLKVDKSGGAFIPEVAILDSTVTPLAGLDAFLKSNRKGNQLTLKKFTLPYTGTYYLAISSGDG